MTTEIDKPDWLENYQVQPGPAQAAPSPTRKKGGFAPGVSGNPAGRKKGSLNKKTTVLAEFQKSGSKVAAAAIAAALEGDVSAMNIVLQRIEPILKARSERVQFALDPDGPLTAQAQQVIAAVADGDVDPDTGKVLIECISSLAAIKGTDELEERLNILEARVSKNQRKRL